MTTAAQEHGIVVVGAGQAGGEIAIELRKLGYAGRVVIVGEESYIPYKRPPLSKAYLAGTAAEESLYVMPRANLEKNRIEFVGDARAVRIDRPGRRVELADGRSLPYDRLALALGGRARALSLPGADKPNVFVLRTIADVNAIRRHCAAGKRVVIVGGGFIGLEAAAILTKTGLKVTVLESLPRVLARVTAPVVSTFFERVHREAGVDLRTGVQIRSFEGDAAAARVVLGDGSVIETDFVIAGIGILANTELAQQAGLTVDNGIVVDEFARTSDPDIVAAGDCTNHPSELFGRRIRLESVQNAMEQARVAAGTLMGRQEPYRGTPWFWSDQYDLKLQMAGLSTGHDQVIVRGDPATQRSFAAFYLEKGRLIAADAVNRPQDFMFARKLVTARATPDPAVLGDDAVPLKTLLPAA